MNLNCKVFPFGNTGRNFCPALILVACLVFFSGTLRAQTTSLNFNEIPYSDPDFLAPGRGTEEWMVMNQVNIPLEGVNSQPHDAYYRFEWTNIEKSKGVYDWTVMDAAFKRAIDKGQKFSFGIMPMCSSCSGSLVNNAKLSYPLYLHNEMQSEASKDWIYNGYWVPNWNSSYFLTAWENMLKAVASHINNTYINGVRLASVVNYIDIRGYGNWGEWHNYSYGNNEPTANKATTSTLLRLIKSHQYAFPDIRLVALSDAFDTGNWSDVPAEVGYYLLTASNNAGQFGWRRDNWGDPAPWYRDKLENNNTFYNGHYFKDLIMNKWKYAPIVGEPSSCCTINGGTCQYWELEAQIRRYHTLSFGNGNLESPTSTCVRNNVRNAAKASGYRLLIRDGSISSSLSAGTQFTLKLNWQNVGITPTYEKWNVVYQLKNTANEIVWSGTSSFKPHMFLPQASPTLVQDNFTLPVTVPEGTYNLYLLVTDPASYRKPLPLAIKGRNADGSYLIQAVTVAKALATANTKPVAHAGNDKSVTLPTNNVLLDGSASSDADGKIVKYRWSQVGGPGTASFTDPSAVTATANSLLQGVYSFRLTVTDDKNDSSFDDVSVTVNAASLPALTIARGVVTDVKCAGAATGTASVTVSGGTAPYTYHWNTNPVQTMSTANNLQAGTYTVTVWDANKQSVSTNITINEPAPLILTVKADSITTNGGSTTVSLSASGGTAPYTFSGPTTGVKAGTYTYTVTDANQCSDTKTISIFEPAAAPPPPPPPPPVSATITNTRPVSCYGGSDGTATVTISGGTSPFTYSWNTSPVQTSATATQLKAGSYTVTVRDATGTSATVTATIPQPPALVLSVSAGTIAYFGGTTNVSVSASGGTPPYTFTGPTSNVSAGTYQYTVKDAKGCTDTETITITQPARLKGRYRKLSSTRTWSTKTSLPDTELKSSTVENEYFNIYPNPVISTMTVSITTAEMGEGTISVINLNGSAVRQFKIQKSTTGFTYTLDLADLARGYYVLRLQLGSGYVVSSKFLKM